MSDRICWKLLYGSDVMQEDAKYQFTHVVQIHRATKSTSLVVGVIDVQPKAEKNLWNWSYLGDKTQQHRNPKPIPFALKCRNACITQELG